MPNKLCDTHLPANYILCSSEWPFLRYGSSCYYRQCKFIITFYIAHFCYLAKAVDIRTSRSRLLRFLAGDNRMRIHHKRHNIVCWGARLGQRILGLAVRAERLLHCMNRCRCVLAELACNVSAADIMLRIREHCGRIVVFNKLA